MVYDKPGVTRDCRTEAVEWLGYKFELTDTPGIDLYDDPSLKEQVLTRIKEKLAEADYIWFLVDGTVGISHFDREIAKLIRKTGKTVILLLNKNDRKTFDAIPFYEFGFKNVVSISAEHQSSLYEIFTMMNEKSLDEAPEITKRSAIAILGRPNAGKSTLINTILGKHYQLTGDQPGLTRESIRYPFDFNDHTYELIDTAGLRKRAKMSEDLERLSFRSSIDSLKFAECVLYLIDGEKLSEFGIDQQDLTMINKVVEEGRCLVIGVSKWDVVKERSKMWDSVRLTLDNKGFGFIPMIPISSFKKIGLIRIFEQVQTALDFWNTRLSTGKLNQWLQDVTAQQPPPMIKGRAVRMKFITQVKTRPPRICIFVNVTDDMLQSYTRYLINQFHKAFSFEGVPIRIFFRQTNNPYANKVET